MAAPISARIEESEDEADVVDFVAPLRVGILLVGLVYAAAVDWRSREVTDALWQLLGFAGVALGGIALSSGGLVPVAAWIIAGGFVVQHLLPWDTRIAEAESALPGIVEIVLYAGTAVFLFLFGWRFGVSPTGLPVEAIAAYVVALAGRALFEAGLLYGGADAKAVMVTGVLLPFFTTPAFSFSANATTILSFYPFAVTMLMNAALFAIAIPLAIGLRNARRGEFTFPEGFIGFSIPVRELPHRWVWLRDPIHGATTAEEERAIETSEEDRHLRERQTAALLAKGARRVWVTPQLPFLILLAAGALAGVLAGNVFIDLLTRL